MRTGNRREFLRNSLAGAMTAAILRLGGAAALADPGSGDQSSKKAFLAAVVAGDLDAVRRRLADAPWVIQAKDEVGRSAFALALLSRHEEIAQVLRESGFQPDLHESALATDWERVAELAAGDPSAVNRDHPIGGTAMYAAAIGGAGTQIWRVYSHGGKPDVAPRGAAGQSAVRAAFEFPDLPTAELTAATLLSNGADPNTAQPEGSTALHAAAARGSVELVEMLIRKGADVDARDSNGRTARELAEDIHSVDTAAVLRNHREIPRDHSTSRNAYDVDGRRYVAPDLAEFALIERSRIVGSAHTDFAAVRGAVDRHPLLAHSVATTTEQAVEASAHMGRQELVDYLLGKGAPYSLPTAVMRNDLTRVNELLEEDPLRIHERGPHDFALLWYPIIGGDLREMMVLLLKWDAQVEQQHWLGTTALHYAAIGGQTGMAELLIENGADVHRAGRKFGAVAATSLRIAEGRGHDEFAAMLRARGATE